MAAHTPRIALFLHKRRLRVKGIPALRAEEVARVPFSSAGNDDFAFEGGFAGLAAGGKEFVVVEVAEEAEAGVSVIHDAIFFRVVMFKVVVCARKTSFDTLETFGALFLGLGVKSYAFQVRTALVTHEASRMKALARGTENTSSDGQSAVCAESARLADEWSVVRQ